MSSNLAYVSPAGKSLLAECWRYVSWPPESET